MVGLREEEETDLFVIAGEEVGFDEIPFAFFKGAKPFSETTPAGGGGPAGAVSVVNLREEEEVDRSVRVGEEVDPGEAL